MAVLLSLGAAPAASADAPQVDRAKLVRTTNGISMMLQTSGLTPGDVVTVWWIINPSGEMSVIRAAGHVIGGSGKGNYAGHVSVGDAALVGPGLEDPHNDEILLIVRTHGQKDPARIMEQLFTPEDTCDPTICTNLLFVFP